MLQALLLTMLIFLGFAFTAAPLGHIDLQRPEMVTTPTGWMVLKSVSSTGEGVTKEIRVNWQQPVDFGPVRLVGENEPSTPVSGKRILNGGDEAPTFWVHGGKILGGNHSFSDYAASISFESGDLNILESYTIEVARLELSWTFTADGQTHLTYQVDPTTDIAATPTIVQLQRPILEDGENLLLISGSSCHDITQIREIKQSPSENASYDLVVVRDGLEQRRLSIALESSHQAAPSMSFYVSPKGKVYLRPFQGIIAEPLTLQAKYFVSWERSGEVSPIC